MEKYDGCDCVGFFFRRTICSKCLLRGRLLFHTFVFSKLFLSGDPLVRKTKKGKEKLNRPYLKQNTFAEYLQVQGGKIVIIIKY